MGQHGGEGPRPRDRHVQKREYCLRFRTDECLGAGDISMGLIEQLFGASPFHPLVEHAKKVHECLKQVRPLTEAMVREDYEEVHRLQDLVSKLEYEADQIKHRIRELLPRKFFLPVARDDLDRYLHCQDNIADGVEDFAVILVIRKTRIHEELVPIFCEFVDQVTKVGETLISCSEELIPLAESSFSGAQAEKILDRISSVGEEEWKADRIQRRLSMQMYQMEDVLGPIDISFYEKMLHALSDIANAAENTGDMLRAMIVKG